MLPSLAGCPMRTLLPILSVAIALVAAAAAETDAPKSATRAEAAASGSAPEAGSPTAAPTEAAPGEPAPRDAAAAVAPAGPGGRPRSAWPGDASDGLSLRERTQRQKIERSAKAAADDLAWIREQREALASTAKDGKRDPRDVELERTEAVIRARIGALRTRFEELTAGLEKRHDGQLPSGWSRTFDCPACP